MQFYVVCLKSKRYIVLPENWIQNPILRRETKVYFSQNPTDEADFSLKILFYLNQSVSGVYEAFVIKKFGEYTHGNIVEIFDKNDLYS